MPQPGKDGRTIPDPVLALVAAAMLLLAAYLLFFGGPADDTASAAADAPPALVLVRPTEGDTVEAVELEIRSGGPLAPQPGGWGSGGFHVHADLDGREIMPGPTDIRRASATTYLWSLPPIPAGTHRISLFWSDPAHRRVTGTETSPIRIIIQ